MRLIDRHAASDLPRKLAITAALLTSLLVAVAIGVIPGSRSQDPSSSSSPPTAKAVASAVAAPVRGLALPPGVLRRFGDDRLRIAGWPLASALSPDYTRLAVLASAGRNQAILTIFDTETGRPVCRTSAKSAGFFATPRLAFSPDGQNVAATISSEVRVVWAVSTGKLVKTLPPSRFGFNLCQITPEGLLVLTDLNQTVLYEIPSGKLVKTWPIGRIARLTADAKTFVRIEKEFESVSHGDTATGAVTSRLAMKTADNGTDNSLAFSDDGKMLAVVHDRKRIQIWDTANWKRLREQDIPQPAIDQNDPHYAVSFSPHGQTIVLETKRGVIHRWDTKTLTPIPRLLAAGANKIDAGALYIRGVHWTKDGRMILAAAGNGLVHRWDAKTGKRFPDEGYNSHLRFTLTPNGSQIVVGDRAGRIDVWDIPTGRVVRQLANGYDRRHALVCLAVSPDGGRLAAGYGHGDIWVFPMEGLEDPQHLWCPIRLDGGWMNFMTWAPDGKSIFASGSGMILCHLNLADGKAVWSNGDENIPSFALTPDGRFIVKTLWESIQFLDASTGEESSAVRFQMTEEQTHVSSPLRAVTVAPDGQRLALAIGQNAVAVCDGAGRELRRFDAADSGDRYHRVETLAFTPDGKWIVSGADDLAVRVWEAATGKLVMRFDGQDSPIEQVAVAPDGRSAFSAGGDGFVYQWDLRPRRYSESKQRLDDLWAVAAGPDPASAVRAAWMLVTQSEESRGFVAEKLPPSAAKDEQVAKWLADLDATAFADREAATKALSAEGRAVERHLRETLQTTRSPEVRRRAKDLLARIETTYTPDELRALRIVQACEISATPPARALLKRWADGVARTPLTEDVKAALARLDRRPK